MEERNRTLEQEKNAILNDLAETSYEDEAYAVMLDRALAIQKQIDEKELKLKSMDLEKEKLEAEKKKNKLGVIGPIATIAAAGITAGVSIYLTNKKIKHSENLAQYVYDNEKEMRVSNGKLWNISQEISH